MHDFINDLYDICDVLSNELKIANEKIRSAGGTLSGSDLEYIDKLTHAIKSVKTTIAMIEAEDDGYSYDHYYRGRDGMSYARGRKGTSVRRDSRGRYSRDGEDITMKLRELMEDSPDEKTRVEIHKLISKIENM